MVAYIVIEVDPRFQSIGSHRSCCFSTSYAPVKTGTLLGFSHSGLVEIYGGKFSYIFVFSKCLYLYLWFVIQLST